ncbi:hypothetical protein R5R35_009687 [Gryllus longicercus]|uniref:Elongation factor EFG domain-containing protein n=1 Tax=Gryllus longicercus TaxID=2509291 RepID=A0AAN9VHR7_9ORTH
MLPYADEIIDVPSVPRGKLAAIAGLKNTVTGDFVTLNASVASAAKKVLSKYEAESPQADFSQPPKTPVPVFYCSIGVPTKECQIPLELALQHLQREDPSLVVTKDEMTGQTFLGGMGELHLSAVKTKIISDYKINVSLGSLRIAYHEIPQKVNIKNSHMLEYKTDNSRQNVSLIMTLLAQSKEDKDTVLLDKSPDSAANIANLNSRYLLAIIQGVNRALLHGPKVRCPVVGTCVMLHWFETSKGTTEQIVSTAASQCVQKLLKAVGTRLLEPIMTVEILCGHDTSSAVMPDLLHRRGQIVKVTQRGQQMVIDAKVPLAELSNYAMDLQKLSQKTGSFTMLLDCYKAMSPTDETKAVKKVTGLNSQ